MFLKVCFHANVAQLGNAKLGRTWIFAGLRTTQIVPFSVCVALLSVHIIVVLQHS